MSVVDGIVTSISIYGSDVGTSLAEIRKTVGMGMCWCIVWMCSEEKSRTRAAHACTVVFSRHRFVK
jgi:hypothetical protein